MVRRSDRSPADRPRAFVQAAIATPALALLLAWPLLLLLGLHPASRLLLGNF